MIKGSMITASRNGESITRNSSLFKRLKHHDEQFAQHADSDTDPHDDGIQQDQQDYQPPQQVPPPPPRRNPGRNRHAPQHLKDYVHE